MQKPPASASSSSSSSEEGRGKQDSKSNLIPSNAKNAIKKLRSNSSYLSRIGSPQKTVRRQVSTSAIPSPTSSPESRKKSISSSFHKVRKTFSGTNIGGGSQVQDREERDTLDEKINTTSTQAAYQRDNDDFEESPAPIKNKTYEEIILRSCEMDPSRHQIAIPAAEEFLTHARICDLMECYDLIPVENTFNFADLVGLSKLQLESILRGGTSSGPAKPHPSIVKSLLECADDIAVERYLRETTEYVGDDGEKEGGRIQVAVFSSQNIRQFIVCFRGSIDQQNKPLKSRYAKLKDVPVGNYILHPNYPVPVHPLFRNAYFANNFESKLFSVIDSLATYNPFCDVVMTGHSFGGALATIAATRYAALYPMMTVSCHAFGAPKVGGVAFRHLAHSLPNLKVIRIENGNDPYPSMPDGPKWIHVGHTITMEPAPSSHHDSLTTNNPSSTSPSPATMTTSAAPALAYRFDEKRHDKQLYFWTGVRNAKTKKREKRNHEIRSYVHSLECFTHLGLPWVTTFVGEKGTGVTGMENEARWVV